MARKKTKTKLITYKQWDGIFNRIEKANLRKTHRSLTAASMSNKCNKAIVEVREDDKTLVVDNDKLNKCKKRFIK